jgi:hypothetical protein
MNMNSNAILDRVEIIFYSTLTSCLSAVNRVRSHIAYPANIPNTLPTDGEKETPLVNEDTPEKTLISSWTYISQALLPLIIWMILGFATGFLLGMVKPR